MPVCVHLVMVIDGVITRKSFITAAVKLRHNVEFWLIILGGFVDFVYGLQVVKRQTMQQIMSGLVGKAYSEYDAAVASWLSARARAAAVAEVLEAEPGSLGALVMQVREEVLAHKALVSSADIRRQGRIRKDDGSIEAVNARSKDKPCKQRRNLCRSYPGLRCSDRHLAGGSTGEDQTEDAGDSAARDRVRRLKKLDLDMHILVGYCIHARWPDALAGLLGSPDEAGLLDSAEPSNKRQRTTPDDAIEPAGQASSRKAVPKEVSESLQRVMAAEAELRSELGMEAVPFLNVVAAGEVRKSRRQAGLDAEQLPAGPATRPSRPQEESAEQPVILDNSDDYHSIPESLRPRFRQHIQPVIGGLVDTSSDSDSEYTNVGGRGKRKPPAPDTTTNTNEDLLMRELSTPPAIYR
eukprot:scaffold166064_cov35-Prasinocladus_malaysianus.AAC.1